MTAVGLGAPADGSLVASFEDVADGLVVRVVVVVDGLVVRVVVVGTDSSWSSICVVDGTLVVTVIEVVVLVGCGVVGELGSVAVTVVVASPRGRRMGAAAADI
ncbi:hypothetical protein GS891_12650 [Rhodococcus hoagii]|nr:hypothetical protein [Prescottella equi]